MMKIFFFIACFIFSLCDSSTSTEITCDYGVENYISIGLIYQCKLSENPQITTLESAQISSVYGTHEDSKTNDDVMGFGAKSKMIRYFPKDLLNFFKNLKAIWIERCGLLEIHQSDLKPFKNLESFDLTFNKIEVIEEGLFDFNPNLKFVSFWERNIFHIDPNVFDHLNQLTDIYLEKVDCIPKDVRDSRKGVRGIINLIKIQCADSGYLALEEKIKNLEKESKTLNFYHFVTKMENLRQRFDDSKFSKFRPLNYRFEKLNNIGKNSENPELELKNCSNFDNPDLLNALKLNQIQTLQGQLKLSQADADNSLNELKTEIKSLQASHSQLISSQNDTLEELKLTQETLKSSQNILNSSQDNIHSSIVDIEDKLANFGEKLEKLDNLEGHLINFEVKTEEKCDRIEKEIADSRHKISNNFDEKIRGIEMRLMKRFEDILEEKLGKILDEKLGKVFDARLGPE